MGNYSFLFSDVKPMAWFCKLKEMRRPKSNSPQAPQSNNRRRQPKTKPVSEPPPVTTTHQSKRPSFNLATLEEDFVLYPPVNDQGDKFFNATRKTHENPAEPPRKSCKSRLRRTKTHSCRCSCHAPTFKNKEPKEEEGGDSPLGHFHKHQDTKEEGEKEEGSPEGHFHKHLPRISANPPKSLQLGRKTTDEGTKASPRVRNPGIRVKLRLTSSPRVGGRNKIQMARGRRSVESLAISKASRNPRRDFMESMMAMIVEYNIRAPGDLEELLARYLSLNSNEYHDIIVQVFEEIWFALNDDRHL